MSEASAEYEPRTFDYRPVPLSVPVALFLGLAGLLGLVTPAGVLVALFGLFLSAWCLVKVLGSGGELGGKWLATAALACAAVGAIGGTAVHAAAFAAEVPEGYFRLNFTEDVSGKGFVMTRQGYTIHPDVAALDGKKVFLKGYMYPTRDMFGLTSFVFCRDSGDCCFGGTPKIEDMILVTMAGSNTPEIKADDATDYHAGLVSVAGTFALRPEGGGESLSPIFKMTAVKVEPSRTPF